MQQKISLLSYDKQTKATSSLKVVKIGSNEVPVIPFTPDGEKIELHYCEEHEINGYVACNGDGCILCKIGRKKEAKILIPVLQPESAEIAVLPVSESLRPHALLPQLINVLKAGKLLGMLISREGAKYMVSTFDLNDDAENSEEEIKWFLEDYETDLLEMSTVYPQISNEDLAGVKGIAKMMKLKRISL